MLKRRLTDEEIQRLALIVVEKSDPYSNIENISKQILEAYMKSIEFFEKQNEKYSDENPPRIRTL